MKFIKVYKALGPIDLKSVMRDNLLVFLPVISLVISLLLRFFVPALSRLLMDRYQFNLIPYYPVIISLFILLLTPLLCGNGVAFLLIEQRDDKTLTALQVSPVSLIDYFWYRITVPMIVSIILSFILFPIANLVKIELWQLAIVVIVAAPVAPISALLYASLAANKIQGLTLMKISGNVFMWPLLAFFVPKNWYLFFGIFPTFWPAKLLWTFHYGEGGIWFYAIFGFLYQSIFVVGLAVFFNWVVSRDLSGIVAIAKELIKLSKNQGKSKKV